MAKQHELAEKDYILGMPYKEIAAKYNVSVETVKSWKKRHGWERDKPVKKNAPIAPSNKKGCTPKKEAQEPEGELSDKEQLFCHYYVKTKNLTMAALKSGYSENRASAQVQGSRLYNRPRVRQEIERLMQLVRQEIQQGIHVDIMDLLSFCLNIIYADLGDYVTFGRKEREVMGMFGPVKGVDGNPLMETVNYINIGESELLDTSVISEIKQGKDGISIKLPDKKWAWEQIIKFYDWLPDKHKRRIEDEKLEIERAKAKDPSKNLDVTITITPPPAPSDIPGDDP